MFGRHYVRRTRRRFEAGAAIMQFSDLKAGDYIVHNDHGIGRYLGLRRFEGKAGDFMTLQYSSGDTLFLPVTRIDEVQKYVAGDGAVPKVDKLGGASWSQGEGEGEEGREGHDGRAREALCRPRERGGPRLQPDTPWQAEFEDAFEYDETPDQLRAIADVKKDMEAARPMDRLLCGDVGYGKTEVASARRLQGGAWTASRWRCSRRRPCSRNSTYNTFSERLADYPIKLEILNRFRTDQEINAAIERLKSGEVDIAIGTHRLLSKDVTFKDLGLVVIDEEQRFGVGHKERLKQLRTQVDCLTSPPRPSRARSTSRSSACAT
jgi:transcription-repair coupling factor (superfamily II helicase)